MSTKTLPLHRQLGLTDGENDRILELMGRTPTDPELVMFSLMWSEHCSYKHSKRLLRGLPTTAPHVLQGPGENAGVVDVGDGWAVAFKIESHNHPSAVEPFEGAATGVGGIVRDIIAMGARPIALLDALRFGPLTSARSRHLFTRVVAGVGHYGNCIGVPNVGGEVAFEDCYEDSCLVNAMCVGILRPDDLLRAAAAGPGNALVLIGNRTGRDGIGGASVLASAELSSDDADKRPSVQIGDPFTERKLMDCCLDLAARGLFVSLQDLGAAGLTSSSSEMASRGGVGLRIDLDRVPLREQGMRPEEILVSESQERMLAVVEPGRVDEVIALCAHYELDATVIGEVTDGDRLVAVAGGEVVADIPARMLADDAPEYDVPKDPGPEAQPLDLADVPEPDDLAAAWLGLLAHPNIASKRWIYQQYDQLVGANTIRRPGGDGAVVRLPDSDRAIAMSTDCAERHCQVDPRGGGAASVCEAARNIACTGARPLAATDCLNFGNPEKGSTGWRLAEAIGGIADACIALGVPIVSGNVSLYNESPERIIYPTPVVGMVGVIENAAHSVGQAFAESGDVVCLVGYGEPRLDASEVLGRAEGLPPRPDPFAEAELVSFLVDAARAGLMQSAHDVSRGGLAVTLAESAIAGGHGARVTVEPGRRADEVLFGEGGGRVVVTCRPDNLPALKALAVRTTLTQIGEVGGDAVEIGVDEAIARIALSAAEKAWERAIPELVDA
jgi:phosphoribosylformylglycinamidine synthase subunit PurL